MPTEFLHGDFNKDGILDAQDIDALAEAIRTENHCLDITGDAQVDCDDYVALVERIFHAQYGDTDLDGDVDLHDFVQLKQGLGKMNAGWADGDFNGDGIVDASDFDMLVYNFGTQSAPLTKRNS